MKNWTIEITVDLGKGTPYKDADNFMEQLLWGTKKQKRRALKYFKKQKKQGQANYMTLPSNDGRRHSSAQKR
jgi:hypothetical protein